jgi:histidinol-phosphate aminotransferase
MLEKLPALPVSVLRDYPDLGELTEAIARRHGIDPERVVVTAGADDAMDRLFRAFGRPDDELLVPVPTFEMIHRFAAATGISVVTRYWTGPFPLAEMLAAISERTTIVALVSPNNPTGSVVTEKELATVAAAAERSVVLFDHVYGEYADEDLTSKALENDNVVVLRTFSKAWGLAGCRVGYALASPELAAILRNAGNPYPVSSLSAWLAGQRLVDGRRAMEEHVAQVRSERERLAAWLAARGIDCPESQGNFLLVEFGERATDLRREMAERGVLVRAFPHRLEIATAVRISLPGDEPGFERLLDVLDATLGKVPTKG